MVVIYFSDLTSKVICSETIAFRNHQVDQQKQASIVIYDYYDNSEFNPKPYFVIIILFFSLGRRANTFYDPPVLKL